MVPNILGVVVILLRNILIVKFAVKIFDGGKIGFGKSVVTIHIVVRVNSFSKK